MPTSLVTQFPAATPHDALQYFETLMAYETDCADVYESLQRGETDFYLLDVRSPGQFAAGHILGAINLPLHKITTLSIGRFAPDKIFVTYCAGLHCNGAHRAASQIAKLGRPVKLMIGGLLGWIDEGYPLHHDLGRELMNE
jgi:rhodanese-related sulfurtransferase